MCDQDHEGGLKPANEFSRPVKIMKGQKSGKCKEMKWPEPIRRISYQKGRSGNTHKVG